jgi:hypothetical protein
MLRTPPAVRRRGAARQVLLDRANQESKLGTQTLERLVDRLAASERGVEDSEPLGAQARRCDAGRDQPVRDRVPDHHTSVCTGQHDAVVARRAAQQT